MKIMLLFSLVIIFFGQTLFASERNRSLSTLINQEIKMLESVKKKSIEFQYRLLELYSERLKFIAERNNQDFLSAENKSKVKEDFFFETRQYYTKAKLHGLTLVKEFSNTKLLPQIFFTLALNSRDFGRDKLTEELLLKAIKYSSVNKTILHHAETALADFYYNEKKYPDAIHYYERSVQNKNDEWYTKNLANLSWCYFKNQQFEKAIVGIKEVFFLSQDKRYIDFADQSLDYLGSFLVYSGTPLEARDFYLQNVKRPIRQIIDLATKSKNKGFQKETIAILEAGQRIISKDHLFEFQEDLLHVELDLFKELNNYVEFEKTSAKFVHYYKDSKENTDKKLPAIHFDLVIEKIKTLTSFLQVDLAKNISKTEASFQSDRLNTILNLFNHLIQLDTKNQAEYLYFSGESLFSVQKYEKAAIFYKSSILNANQSKNTELIKKSINSLLALTGLEVLTDDLNKSYLVFTYEEYLKHWPKEDKSKEIYPKLFNLYLLSKNDQASFETIKRFTKDFPHSLQEQRESLKSYLDYLIDAKKTDLLAFLLMDLKNGFLSFNHEFISKVELTLGDMLFLQYESLARNGESAKAIKGFESIYFNKIYPDNVKYRSALYISEVYLNLADTKNSLEWTFNSLTKMTREEVSSKRSSLLALSEKFYLMQDFNSSFKLSDHLLQFFCEKKDSLQKRFFEIGVMTSIADDSFKKGDDFVKNGTQCVADKIIISNAQNKLYLHLVKKEDYFGLRSFVKTLGITDFKENYLQQVRSWYWEMTHPDDKQHLLTFLKEERNVTSTKWVAEIGDFEKFLNEKGLLLEESIWGDKVFNPKEFNHKLSSYLKKVSEFTKKYSSFSKSDQNELLLKAFSQFSEFFSQVSFKISSLKMVAIPVEMKPDFDFEMNKIANEFTSASKKYDHQLSLIVQKIPLSPVLRQISKLNNFENPVLSFNTGFFMDKLPGDEK
jgi:hypothetical protein